MNINFDIIWLVPMGFLASLGWHSGKVVYETLQSIIIFAI